MSSECPLSYPQERIWFAVRESSSQEYNLVTVLRITGALDWSVMRDAVESVCRRHEILRTRFVVRNGNPVQVVESAPQIDIQKDDLAGLKHDEKEQRVSASMTQEYDTTFDLSGLPLVRFRILQLDTNTLVLLRTVHQIVSDCWSHRIFDQEFGCLYAAFRRGAVNPLKPLRLQYADFSLRQRGDLRSGLEYWQRQLSGFKEFDITKSSAPRSAPSTVGVHTYTIENDGLRSLRAFSQTRRVTLYMILLTALAATLARLVGGDDIVIASPVANRSQRGTSELIGHFANRVLIRARISHSCSYSQLLEQLKYTVLEAQKYQDVPLEALLPHLEGSNCRNWKAPYSVALSYQSAPANVPSLDALQVEFVPVRRRPRAECDLDIRGCERDGLLDLVFLYRQAVLNNAEISEISRQLTSSLDTLVGDSKCLVLQREAS